MQLSRTRAVYRRQVCLCKFIVALGNITGPSALKICTYIIRRSKRLNARTHCHLNTTEYTYIPLFNLNLNLTFNHSTCLSHIPILSLAPPTSGTGSVATAFPGYASAISLDASLSSTNIVEAMSSTGFIKVIHSCLSLSTVADNFQNRRTRMVHG